MACGFVLAAKSADLQLSIGTVRFFGRHSVAYHRCKRYLRDHSQRLTERTGSLVVVSVEFGRQCKPLPSRGKRTAGLMPHRESTSMQSYSFPSHPLAHLHSLDVVEFETPADLGLLGQTCLKSFASLTLPA